MVVLSIPSARTVPTAFKNERYIRIGSSKENIKKHPEREAALFRALNYGPPSLLNTPSRFNKLSFEQLFVYYETKGIRLREDTFKENLELLTADGKYNMLAQLLSDDPHIDIQFALFTGKTKASTMYAVRNFGHMCILFSLDKVLDYGDTINVPQADERDRKVERKEVMLFDKKAFREAVINAFVHNLWLNEDAPMFTSYQDRIEITSIGNLPPKQTKDGFYRGRSIPVNKKLSEIFVQLHISEKSGRGVPRIVKKYGKEAFEFADNSIVVTIPFDRLDLYSTKDDIQDKTINTQDNTQDGLLNTQDGTQDNEIKVLEFCTEPHGLMEIAEHLGFKQRKSVKKVLVPLVESGRIAMTIPDKPTSKNQKYITIR